MQLVDNKYSKTANQYTCVTTSICGPLAKCILKERNGLDCNLSLGVYIFLSLEVFRVLFIFDQ